MTIIRIELALEELPDEDESVAVLAQADEVRQQHLTETGGQPRREVAHLVSVREDYVTRLDLLDELFQR